MSALDTVLNFSIDDWTDALRWAKSPQAKLLRNAAAELAALRSLLDRAEDWMTTQAPTAPEVVAWKADRRKAERG